MYDDTASKRRTGILPHAILTYGDDAPRRRRIAICASGASSRQLDRRSAASTAVLGGGFRFATAKLRHASETVGPRPAPPSSATDPDSRRRSSVTPARPSVRGQHRRRRRRIPIRDGGAPSRQTPAAVTPDVRGQHRRRQGRNLIGTAKLRRAVKTICPRLASPSSAADSDSLAMFTEIGHPSFRVRSMPFFQSLACLGLYSFPI